MNGSREIFGLRTNISKKTYILAGTSNFLLFLGTWAILSYGGFVRPYFLPTPTAVIYSIYDLFVNYDLLNDIAISFYRVMMGFFLAVIIAVPLGITMGSFKIMEAFIEPLNDFIRYMPVPAFIPLVILWVGLGSSSQITLIFMGTFFQLLVMIADKTANVPKEYIEISYNLHGVKRFIILKDIILRAASPGIFDDLRVAAGWAWSYLVLAEIVAANSGIGHMIMESQRFLRTSNVIAGIMIIGIMGLSIDYLFKIAYRILFPWSEKEAL